MPQTADKNYRPQNPGDKELKQYTRDDLNKGAKGLPSKPRGIPGTQDTGSVSGAIARRHIADGTTARVGVAGRDTVKDTYNVARQIDKQEMNKYMADQTSRMKAAMAKRKSANTVSAPKGRKTMGALLGIAGAAQAMKNRGR
jgi:hypothetical protein